MAKTAVRRLGLKPCTLEAYKEFKKQEKEKKAKKNQNVGNTTSAGTTAGGGK